MDRHSAGVIRSNVTLPEVGAIVKCGGDRKAIIIINIIGATQLDFDPQKTAMNGNQGHEIFIAYARTHIRQGVYGHALLVYLLNPDNNRGEV